MLKIQIGGEEHSIYFHHYYDGDALTETDCMIQSPSKDVGAAAIVHPYDIGKKDYGRKLSLARAMTAANWDKATRSKVWQEYFKATGKNYNESRLVNPKDWKQA